jgi:hypothetical protein
MKRIMYIEAKGGGLDGPARIGWVEYSRSFRSLYYRGRRFEKCVGYKYNCFDAETGERYWISGPKKDGYSIASFARSDACASAPAIPVEESHTTNRASFGAAFTTDGWSSSASQRRMPRRSASITISAARVGP